LTVDLELISQERDKRDYHVVAKVTSRHFGQTLSAAQAVLLVFGILEGMKTAIILHGMPSKEEYLNPESSSQSNKHWIPWIQKELILNGVLAQAIELPEPYTPIYEQWSQVFEQFDIDEETILIGHSCGAGFLVRWLSENNAKVGKVALVAPWLDPAHELSTGFFDFNIDTRLVTKTKSVDTFFSTDDDDIILKSVEQIRLEVNGVGIHEFSNRGHFTFGDMKTEEFPELRDIIFM